MTNRRFFRPSVGMTRIRTVNMSDDGRGRSVTCAIISATGRAPLLIQRRFVCVSYNGIVARDGGAIAVTLQDFFGSDVRVFVEERGVVKDGLEVFGNLEKIKIFGDLRADKELPTSHIWSL